MTQGLKNCGNEGLNRLQGVAWGCDDDDTDSELSQTLLKPQASINGEQRIELRCGQGEKVPSPFAGPALLRGRPYLVTG